MNFTFQSPPFYLRGSGSMTNLNMANSSQEASMSSTIAAKTTSCQSSPLFVRHHDSFNNYKKSPGQSPAQQIGHNGSSDTRHNWGEVNYTKTIFLKNLQNILYNRVWWEAIPSIKANLSRKWWLMFSQVMQLHLSFDSNYIYHQYTLINTNKSDYSCDNHLWRK